MCRSKAEGGQRCYSHALTALENTPAETVDVNGQPEVWHGEKQQRRLRARLVDLASTERGQALVSRVLHDSSAKQAGDGEPEFTDAEVAVVMSKLITVYGDDADAAFQGLRRIREEGTALAERNRQERSLAGRLARFREKAKRIGPALGVTVASTAAVLATASPNAAVQTVGGLALTVGACVALPFAWRPWFERLQR